MVKIGRNEPCPCGSGKKYKKCHGCDTSTAAPVKSLEDAILAMYQESLAIEQTTFGELSTNLARLVRELQRFERVSTLSAVAALALSPENRTHIIRIDCLLCLIAAHCIGQDRVTVQILDRWLNQQLADSPLRRREDPAEDIAVANVMTPSGNFRVFTGDWSNPDYYLQDVLDALYRGPDELRSLRNECYSILKISEFLAARGGYARLTGNSESESAGVWLPDSQEALAALSRQVLIDDADLTTLGLELGSVQPFLCSLEEFCAGASAVKVGDVRRKPFIQAGSVLIVAHPTAVTMALVWHAFSAVQALGMSGGLQKTLARVQGSRTLKECSRGVPADHFLTSLLPRETAGFQPYISQTAFRFDQDKYLHLLFLHDDAREIACCGPHSDWHPPFRDSLEAFVKASVDRFLADGGCRGGLTLVVIGGVWRGCAIALPKEFPPSCGLQVWSSADLDRLIANEPRWQLLLWKLSMQQRALAEIGIRIEAHSDANLYSMWAHHDYRLVPRDHGSSLPNDIAYGAEFIFDMRREHRSGLDDHSIYRPGQNYWERVRKLHTRSYFQEDSARKTYGALRSAAAGVLEGAVETEHRAWWVDCSTAVSDPAGRRLVYDLWESSVNWIDRIAPVLDRMIPELGSENLIIDLDLSEIIAHEEWTLEAMKSLTGPNSIPMQVSGRLISVRIPIGLLAMAYSPKNDAERVLVATFAKGALAVARVADEHTRLAGIISALALSDDDRFMHLFPSRNIRGHLREFDLELPDLLHDDEMVFDAVHIAQEAGLPAPSNFQSLESAHDGLNRLVDALWKRISARLREIDRADLILACLTNHERLLREHDRWKWTSRAVLALHKDQADVLKASQAVKEKHDRTQIIDRILVEMALCTSPLRDGRPASQADLDYLGTHLLLLIATAAQSDAVRAGCAAPFLEIFELGDFSFGDTFKQVMRPYMASQFERTHMADVQKYEDLFDAPPTGTKTQEEVFGCEFVEAFCGEFGIAPARLADLAILLGEDAIARGAVVVVQDLERFASTLAAAGFSPAEIEGLQRSFTLVPREKWDVVQKPFRKRDWWPWKYRRRLSLMTRPFVNLGDGRIVYAPAFCEDSFRHTVMESFTGAFDTEYFDTKRMKQYAGSVNARRGLEFNSAVASSFREQGWNVRLEVAMSEFEAPPSEASGDVDVLAWEGNTVCVCECKELLLARTVSEVADQLVRFRGLPGDDLDKHLRRSRFIQSHSERLFRMTGIEGPQVVPLLVTSKIVPMQFTTTFTTQVVSADQITADFLAGLLRQDANMSEAH